MKHKIGVNLTTKELDSVNYRVQTKIITFMIHKRTFSIKFKHYGANETKAHTLRTILIVFSAPEIGSTENAALDHPKGDILLEVPCIMLSANGYRALQAKTFKHTRRGWLARMSKSY